MITFKRDVNQVTINAVEDQEAGRESEVTLTPVWKRVVHVLTLPFSDCRRTQYPRTVPEYSMLVLVTCLANPAYGALVYLLHKRAIKLFQEGKKGTADIVYIFTIILAHIIIGATIIGLALLVAYYTLADYVPHAGDDTLNGCVLYDQDLTNMRKLNMSKREYCRENMLGNVAGKAPDRLIVVDKNYPECQCSNL